FPNTIAGGFGDPDTQYFQIGAYLQHIPTGLFVYGAYGNNELDFAGGASFESDTYYVKAGLRRNLNPLGATVFYGEYLNVSEDDLLQGDLDVWGLGIVQEIDAAAMSLWISYRHLSYDDALLSATGNSVEDFQYVKAGALINF
ncbi:MAG TPA: porin, partial [Hyphomicrobium sp.]|nr:porin [Hyphomicrobium sp.]HRO50432.1 porin [Hyphomicrobium sp.]